MSLDALFPAGGAHAIQNVAFVVNWSADMTDAELRSIRAVHPMLRELFPVEQEMQMVQMTVRAEDAVPIRPQKGFRPSKPKASVSRQVLGGIQFVKPAAANRFGQAAVSRAIQVHRQNFVVAINEYKGWAEAWAVVEACLNAVLPLIVKGRPILGCTLQYHDSFSWKDDPEKLKLSEVFRADGNYLPRSAFLQESLWHSHHGYMEQRHSPVPHQLIENVNVDVAQTDPFRVINILLSHVGAFGASGWDFSTAMSQIVSLMSDFHERDKTIMCGLLTDEVCRKIGLIRGD